MSDNELVLSLRGQSIRVQVSVENTSANHGATSSAEASVPPETVQPELVPAEGAAPLHLLVRSQLGAVPGFSAEDRIRRAYRLGQEDARAALLGEPQAARDIFPLASRQYVVLYQPNGDWPKVLGDLRSFYKLVKVQVGDREPGRASPWKEGIYSRGFASKVETEAYLWGASCRYPREQ